MIDLCRQVALPAVLALLCAAPAHADKCSDQFEIAVRAFPALPNFVRLDPASVSEACTLVFAEPGPTPVRISWEFDRQGDTLNSIKGLATNLPNELDVTQPVEADFLITWDRNGQQPSSISLDFRTGSQSGVSFTAKVEGVDFETPETLRDTLAEGRAPSFVVRLGTQDGFADVLFDQFQFDGFTEPLMALDALRQTLPALAVLPDAEKALLQLAADMPGAQGELELTVSMASGVPVVPIWRYYVFSEFPPRPPEGFETIRLDARWTPASD